MTFESNDHALLANKYQIKDKYCWLKVNQWNQELDKLIKMYFQINFIFYWAHLSKIQPLNGKHITVN